MLGYGSLSDYFATNFKLIHHYKYDLAVLDNMIPWEKMVYMNLLKNLLETQEIMRKQEEAEAAARLRTQIR